MKVKKFKELLNKLPDSMDIYLYNSLVDDFVDIELGNTSTRLYKMKQNILLELINKQNPNSPPKTLNQIRKSEWELPDEFNLNNKDIHISKRVNLLYAKKKGKETFDRLGGINY